MAHNYKNTAKEVQTFQNKAQCYQQPILMDATRKYKYTVVYHSFIKFNIKFFFLTMVSTQLYVRILFLLACGKHVHYRIISQRREVWTIKLFYPHNFLLYQARIMSGHVICVQDIILPLFLRLFDCILEMFRMCSFFVFYFIT